MGLLEDKVAVVTGAGSGLGREYALALAAEGAAIVVNDFGTSSNGDRLASRPADDVVAEIVAAGGRAVANYASVSEWSGAESIINDAVTQLGGLDIVVNNAGINRPTSLVKMKEENVDMEVGVHLKGTLGVSHFAAAYWASTGSPARRAIINTTSAAGLHPTPGGGVYGAAKAGIAALTVSHALELASLGVCVNAVAPCARTRMVKDAPGVLAMMPESDGFDRHAPEHVAPVVVYLASDLCSMTGMVLAVEGPDVAMYQPTGVLQSWSREYGWTPETLARALEDAPRRLTVEGFVPGGVSTQTRAPGRVLKALDQARS